jgi:hypothetical protein
MYFFIVKVEREGERMETKGGKREGIENNNKKVCVTL